MLQPNIKCKIDIFISEEYTQIHEVASTLYGDDPSELISKTYESILKGNETPWLLKSIETDKLYLFFFMAMKYQRSNIFKDLKKLKYNELTSEVPNPSNEDDIAKQEDIENYDEILKSVDRLLFKGKINWYQHRIFYLFYDFDSIINIKDMSTEDILFYRKMSLRKMEKFLGISYVTIHYAIKEVKKKLDLNNIK